MESFTAYVHPDDRGVVDEAVRGIFTGASPADFDFRIIAADGSTRVLNTRAEIAQRDPEGKVLVVAGTNQDITDRKRMEEALKESEEKFRVLSESSPVPVLVYRGDRILYLNDAAVAISGYPREELFGMGLLDFVHPDSRENVKRRAEARMQGDATPARSRTSDPRRPGA